MLIHRLDEDDWHLLQEVRLRALREDPQVFGASLAREERFREPHWRMRARSSPMWVAVDEDGTGRAVVGLIQEPGSPTDDRHVVSLWVASEVRRRGVAWSLLDTVRQAAVDDGARTISLWVGDENHAAVDLCVRAGFTRTGERHAAQRDPEATEERYVRQLP